MPKTLLFSPETDLEVKLTVKRSWEEIADLYLKRLRQKYQILK